MKLMSQTVVNYTMEDFLNTIKEDTVMKKVFLICSCLLIIISFVVVSFYFQQKEKNKNELTSQLLTSTDSTDSIIQNKTEQDFSATLSDKNKNYEATLQYLQSIIIGVYSDDFEDKQKNNAFPSPDKSLGYNWSNMIVDIYQNRNEHTYGYFFFDLDKNGIDELFFVRDDYFVLAIFSQNDDDVTLLDSFWQRYSCTVDSSNNLYTFSSNGAQDFYYTQKSYDHTTKTFTETSTFGCNNGIYFQNDKTITQEEYISLVNGINKEPSFYKEKILLLG